MSLLDGVKTQVPARRFWVDLAERIGFTVAYVVIGVVITNIADLDYVWVVPITGALNLLKGLIAKRFGDPTTAGFTN